MLLISFFFVLSFSKNISRLSRIHGIKTLLRPFQSYDLSLRWTWGNSCSLRSTLIFQDLVNWTEPGGESSFAGDERKERFSSFFSLFWKCLFLRKKRYIDSIWRSIPKWIVLRTCCRRSDNSRDFFHFFFLQSISKKRMIWLEEVDFCEKSINCLSFLIEI